MRIFITLLISLHLVVPIAVWAKSTVKTPLSYTLQEYGELCVSAFAGLVAFWLCEYFTLNPLLTSAIVGMSGHAGAKGLIWVESAGQKVLEKKLGIDKPKEDQ
jgi:hypothetical protein